MQLPELLTDEHLLVSGPAYDRREAARRRLEMVASVAGAVALIVVVLFDHHRISRRLGGDWFLIALAVADVALSGVDVLNGTFYSRYTGTTRRWEEPKTFWAEISVLLLLSAGMLIGAIGDLLGLWRV